MSLLTHIGRPRARRDAPAAKFPGVPAAMDGNTAVVMCEREASDAAGAYPITPSTQMGEGWAEASAQGHLNISGRPLIFVEPEGEHAAAAVTAGMAMTGLRAANFSSGQGIAYMHESLYAAVGKRLTYVLNIGARAMTKATLNVHAGHDDYHAMDDTGFFQLFARDAQSAADLNLIAHRTAELALTPGAVAQDGFLTTHLIESMRLPERALIAEYLGRPEDTIDTPTPGQRIVYGKTRRRIPRLWDVDNPIMAGLVQNQDAYMQSVAAQRPFFFDHLQPLVDQAFEEYAALTGRRHARVLTYKASDADYLILGQGSLIPTAEAVADYLRETRGIRVGVVNLVMFRPFPADLVGRILKGKRGVAILERLDQPLAADLPLMREIRAVLGKCLENGREPDPRPYPDLEPYDAPTDAPALYSGSFGLGSRDLQPEGVIGAIENMLPGGDHKRFFYLSIDFVREPATTPKQAVYQQTIEESYPHVKTLAVHGSENPNLMPKNSITVRFHSVGGWGAITTGKNLAITLFDLLGYHVKANPKYGSEKKGQPTTYYLSVAPEPIRVNSDYVYVDVVLSPDPHVFQHTNALAGLTEGGVFIIQSDRATPAEVWADIPPAFRQIIVTKRIGVFCLDGFRIAREEATDPDLQLRMQGIAFQGAFFAASPVMRETGFDEARLTDAIRAQLERKFGGKGARVVEDNLRVVRRGFDEVRAVPTGSVTEAALPQPTPDGEPAMPVMVKRLPQSQAAVSDIHRFWAQTGSFYARGLGSDSITDPFIGLGVMPASTALFRDMTGIRFEHPQWVPENCTACGECYTVCPDTAIPGLVTEIGQALDTVVERVRKHGHSVTHLPKAVRVIERLLHESLSAAGEGAAVSALIEETVTESLSRSELTGSDRTQLEHELTLFREELDRFPFALTRPYYTVPEQQQPGSGGLFSITINPSTCKGCGECVQVCDDDALRSVPQSDATITELRKRWDFWLDLPTTPQRYIRVDDLEEGVGALETILLDKRNYLSFTSGDGACLGCAEKTALHLFIGTVEALMRPRVERHVAYLSDLISKLQQHIQLALVAEIDVGDADRMAAVVRDLGDNDVTLAGIAARLERLTGGQPIDHDWLRRMTLLVAKLKTLCAQYTHGTTGRGRAAMGILNATGCTSVWGSTYPFNPYPYPWANHLFQDSPSMAMGVFEGHMTKMADDFKAIRMAELELDRPHRPAADDDRFARFTWRDFTDAEWELCPPVAVVGGDGAMYDIGFQNLSRLMASGKPIKVLVVDTQVYSNTGGQACTSGFLGQISDMAPFGAATQGKTEPRKEIGLIGMAHRTTYVMQSTIAYPSHMIEGFIKGLSARRPALFNIYTSCQPEHGIGDDMSAHQGKLAVESRAYPLFRYDPGAGTTPKECLDLDGNPALDQDWPTYTLTYRKGGREEQLPLPMTFADFAMTESRFRKHFRLASPDTWNERMVPLVDFLALSTDERDNRFPYIWSVDRKHQLTRLLVDRTMVESSADRRDFWTLLRALAGVGQQEVSRETIETEVRQEVAATIAAELLRLAGGTAKGPGALASPTTPDTAGGEVGGAPPSVGAAESEGRLAPWIDTDQCTACGDCIEINPKIFAYNQQEKAYLKDPAGGPYKDIVRAAERCTARIIHPGVPSDRDAKDIDKWIARGQKFN